MIHERSVLLGLLLATACSATTATAQSYRETKVANHFQIFAPPNNNAGTRYSVVVVTALAGTATDPCIVDLVDDGADGDTDDTQLNVSLTKGESLIRYIRDGAVNDDSGGVWDGDYFLVDATQPVSVYIATDSDWQHDWAPSDNGTLRGTRFFLYTNGYTVSRRDIDVFAYEDGTRVELYDVTASPLTSSGVTSLSPRPDNPLLSADLDEGEDLLVRYGLGRDLLDAGHTYELVATAPVTVLFGAIASVNPQNQARDGGGFAPGRSGSAIDNDFYFHVPTNPGLLNEEEIRIIAFDDGVVATLYGWNDASNAFEQVYAWALERLDHADYVGGGHRLYRLQSTGGPVVAFEANWLETGSAGTSDVASYAPGLFGVDGSQEFLVYLGPPGDEGNTTFGGTYVHLWLFSRGGQTSVQLTDADSGGGLWSRTVDVPALGYVDVALTTAEYATLNQPQNGRRPYVRIDSASPISVAMANWNDNWMAYATATVLRNPEVTLTTSGSATVGATLQVNGTVSNTGATDLTDVTVDVTLGSGLDYVSGTLDGSPATSVTAGTETQVTYQLDSLAAGQSVALSLEADVTQDAGSAGEVISVDAVATADESGTTLGSSQSTPLTVETAAVATLSGLAADAADGTVTLSWTASGGAAGTTTMAVERSGAPDSGFLEISGSVRNHPAGTTSSYNFLDASVQNGQSYYYRIRGTGPGGETTYAGPILAQPADTTPPSSPSLTVVPGDRSVTVLIAPVSALDLLGYRVYRRRVGTSSWTQVGPNPIQGETYVDSGLTNGTEYEYRATAVDDDGNSSAYSAVVSATPLSPPNRSANLIVFYEDMIGSGSNDWDYNDFIVRVQTGETLSGGSLSRLIIDYEPLARGAGYVHNFRQRVDLAGSWSATLVRYDAAGGVTFSETYTGNGELDIEIFEETIDALPPVVANYANTARDQANHQPGATASLVIDVSPGSNPDGSYGTAPFDPYIRMPYLPIPNTVHLPNQGGPAELTSRFSELAGFPLDFAYTVDASVPQWSFEAEPVWLGFPDYSNWVRLGTPSAWYASPRSPSEVWSESR